MNKETQGKHRKNIFFKPKDNRLFLIHGDKRESNTCDTTQIVTVVLSKNLIKNLP